MACSVGLRLGAVECFRAHETTMGHQLAARKLVTDGPFAWSRNPMYLSMLGNMSAWATCEKSSWSPWVVCLWQGLGLYGRRMQYIEVRWL